MKKWLFKSNEWYDSLEEKIRYILFIVVVGGGIVFCELKLIAGHPVYLPLYLLILTLWRLSYIILKNLN